MLLRVLELKPYQASGATAQDVANVLAAYTSWNPLPLLGFLRM
jgi:hypothetical protein